MDNWCNSYLSDRTRRVKWCSINLAYLKSLFLNLLCTICTPNQFLTLFVASIYHSYADDTQLYVTITKDRECNVIENMKKCVAEIKIWMTNNIYMLKLNDDKTELFVFAPQGQVDAFKI